MQGQYRYFDDLRDAGPIIDAGALVISEERFRDGREWTRQVRPAGPHELPTLQAVSVEGLLAEAGCERVTILKVDIERAETIVFGAGRLPWLDRVDNIAIELHDDECRSIFARALAGRGFAHSARDELTVCRRAAPPTLPATVAPSQ